MRLNNGSLTGAERRAYADAQRVRSEAPYFADAASAMAELALEGMASTDMRRAAVTSLAARLRVAPEGEYRWWVENEPAMAYALAQAGRARAKRLQIWLATWIAADMPEVDRAA